MPTIRKAELADCDAINSLSMHLGYDETTADITQERLKNLLDSSSDWVWVFEDSGNISGWIHIFTAHRLASTTFNEIGGLVVAPTARKQSIGRKLVEFAAIESAKQNLRLRVRCDSRRTETHQFYDHIGFTKVKSQYVYNMLP